MNGAALATEKVTVKLRDGRNLAYGEYGDAGGRPVLLMHGFPDSRLTRHPDDSATARLGVRVIAPDRPGIGGSDFVAARSVAERVDDLHQLVDALQLRRFAVLGWSAGGPYALACAAAMPDRVTAVGVVCGFAPMDRSGATEGMGKDMRRFIPLLRRFPWLARPMMAGVAKQYAKDPEKAFQKQFGSNISAADAAVLARPEIHDNMFQGAREAARQGGRGLASEMQLLFARTWGFRPEEVRTDASLWYGDADLLVPLQVPKYLAGAIPKSRLEVYPGEGHMLFYTHWGEMLRTLASA